MGCLFLLWQTPALWANPCSGCRQGGTAFQNAGCPAGKSCMHVLASRLIASNLSKKICFSGTRFFWALIFHVLGGCWAEIMLFPTMQSKCLAPQWNHEAFIHSVFVLVNILAQTRVSLHQKQMVLPTLPTYLKSRGQKVFGEYRAELEMSQTLSQLFCNSALAG